MRILSTDLYCCSYLLAHGAVVIDLFVDRTGGRDSGTFVLEGGEELLERQEEYFRGHAVAPVKAIRDGVTQLRARLAIALRRGQAHRNVSPRPALAQGE